MNKTKIEWCDMTWNPVTGCLHGCQYCYPTFHRYRLDEPAQKKKPQNIFVSSMGDLFGDWVPDSWIKTVFEATNKAPQHNYLYLTKNPDRYYQLGDGDNAIIPDDGLTGWFGASAETEEAACNAFS